jgi:hypothetical protein
MSDRQSSGTTESTGFGWFVVALAGTAGIAIGVALGFTLSPSGGSSIAEITTQRDHLAAENTALTAERDRLRGANATLTTEKNRTEHLLEQAKSHTQEGRDPKRDAQPRVGALDATLQLAKAQRRFRLAAGFKSVEAAEEGDRQIMEMSNRVNVPPSTLYLTAANAMWQRCGLPRQDALAATEVVAELLPDDPEERDRICKVVLSIRRGSKMSIREAAGWLVANEQRLGMKASWIGKLLMALPDEDPHELMAVGLAIAAGTDEDPTEAVVSLVEKLHKTDPNRRLRASDVTAPKQDFGTRRKSESVRP